MRIVRLLAIQLLAVIFIASCANDEGEKTLAIARNAMPQKLSTSTELASNTIPEQLNFTAQTISGVQFDGPALAGLPTVMWFWAPWCPNCKREAPNVAAAALNNPDVQFVGVAAQDSIPAMQEFVATYGIDHFPNLADTDGAVWQRFGVTYQPAYAFIAPDGQVDVVVTSLGSAGLQDRIDGLFA